MKRFFMILTAIFFIFLVTGIVYGQKDSKEAVNSDSQNNFVFKIIFDSSYFSMPSEVNVNNFIFDNTPCYLVAKKGDRIGANVFPPFEYTIMHPFESIEFLWDIGRIVKIDDRPPKPYYISVKDKKSFESLMKVPPEKLDDVQCIYLNPDYASILKHLPSLKDVQVLIFFVDQIHLKDIEKVYDVCPDLSSLAIGNMQYFEQNINPIAKFKNLKSLELHYPFLTDLSPLEKLTGLQTLKLQSLIRIKDITPLSKLSNLRSLELIELKKLYDISPIAKLKNLERLYIQDCFYVQNSKKLSGIGPITKLKNLESLYIQYCFYVQIFSPLSEMTSLKSLIILPGVVNLNFLSKLSNLEELNLGIRIVDNLDPLANCHNLRYLSLYGYYSNKKKLVSLDNFPNLVSLDLYYFPEIDELPGIENEQNLLRINLTSLPKLKNLDMLSNTKSLRILKIADCEGITNIEPLKNLTNLTSFELNYNSFTPDACNITDLSPLRSCKNLKILKLIDCDKITDISPLNDLPNLEYLVIKNCDNIKWDDINKLQKLNPNLKIL